MNYRCRSLLRIAPVLCLLTSPLAAKPLFLKQAKAAGMADIQSCIACHVNDAPKGGPWNARGNWLRAEKARRHAMVIDVSWLKEFPIKAASTDSK